MQDAAGQSIFCRDMVRLITSPAAPNGMVLRCKPPKAVVLLPDGTEVTADTGDVLLADRSYLRPGMTVVLASPGDQQLGVVTGTDVELDLVRWSSSSSPDVGVGEDESTTTTSAAGVSPAALRRVRELCVRDYVVSEHWLGRVFEVSLDVDVIFDDGEGVCRVIGAESKLWPV
ncbi:hypothetical protein HU200_053468 [Digitaria exilis]|uniref:Uncharacterized protein n=1 Tax=Digitaria exilis TaxID=1010633 RepID=A0A835E683_9POAL|nr:hypothetical protein HU200_053468 [Digitaria exilis]